MILADSLQILENEVVQEALTHARGTGMLIGAIIMAVMMVAVLLLVGRINKDEQNRIEKSNALSNYLRLKHELSWIEMVDICKRCIEGDIRIANPVITLFNEFPSYDEERKKKELKYFPEIADRYKTIVDDRTAVVTNIEGMAEQDINNIRAEMAKIEQQYPEETAEYNRKYQEQILKRQDTNDGNSES